MEKQLRLDAVDVRRVEQQLEEMPQQRFFRGVGRAGPSVCAVRRAGQSEYIADDGLGLLVDAEHVARHLAGFKGGVAGQHVVVEILHQQPGRGAIVPVQALLPELALRLQHGAQHRRREVPQVENFDGRPMPAFFPIRFNQRASRLLRDAPAATSDHESRAPVLNWQRSVRRSLGTPQRPFGTLPRVRYRK